MTATFSYTMADGTRVNESGPVTIDTENSTLTFAFDLTNFTGSGVEMYKTNNSEKGAYWTKAL